MRSRPVLLYDGDCAFCTTCAGIAERRIGPDAEIVPWQFADLAELGVSAEQATDAVQWVARDGGVSAGHEAVAAMLRSAGPFSRLAGRILLAPGISQLAALVYRQVADNRHRLPGGTPACRR